MGAFAFGSWYFLVQLGITSRLLLCAVPVAVSGIVYVAAVVFLKVIQKEDCLLLPKGEKLARLLRL